MNTEEQRHDPLKKTHTGSPSYQDTRGHWGSRMEFLLACLGFSVGLGNLWRFPYLAYENGGAAFLLPYLLLLVIVGRPLYLTEVALGQYSQLGPLHTYRKLTPLMAGLGYLQLLSELTSSSYMIILGYSLHYLFTSLTHIGHTLPWSKCDPAWAKEPCHVIGVTTSSCRGANNTEACAFSDQSSSTQYWRHEVLRLDSEGLVNFGELGGLIPSLVLCLFVGWVITCLCLIKGIKTTGKVVYFTATFPFFVLLVLVVAGALLPGASKGLVYLFVPKWEKLLDVNVWRKALEQVVYSLSIGGGGLVTFGSYNDFNTKVHIDVLILSVLDLIASLMCAVTIFSVMGAMAYELGIEDVSKVVASGPGLAFVAYPEAIARTLPVPHVWCFLFFTMFFILGLSSLFGGMELLMTALLDEFPQLRRRKPVIVVGLCVFLFCLGLPSCTPKGQYIIYLIDVFNFGIGSLLAAFITCVTVHWVFGVNNFSDMIEFMLGFRPSVLMRVTWACIAPVLLLAVFVGSLLQWSWPLYAGVVQYPVWALLLGAAMPLVTLAPLVVVALVHVIKLVRRGRVRDFLKPHHSWGPGCPVARQRLGEVVRHSLEELRLNTRVTKSTVDIPDQ
ncbi:sodium-dependent proline transporter [Hyalella azteca]|uniref:Transporter n=1 Tax=Hyalella azteca TaxID=294128 RepID=A0A979FXR8_HYAAZ|nr:sodium-dependent proline transporter [Hyalella azteca]